MRYHLREVTQMAVSVLASQYLVGQRAQELEEVEDELSVVLSCGDGVLCHVEEYPGDSA